MSLKVGDALLLFNISRPQRLIELSNETQMPSRTLAENSRPNAFHLDDTAVQLHEHLCDRESESNAIPGVASGCMHAVESGEYPWQMLWRDTSTGVGDRHPEAWTNVAGHADLTTGLGVLEGVVKEDHQHAAQA